MKRVEFLKSLLVLPFLNFFKAPAVSASDKLNFERVDMKDEIYRKGLSAIHISDPTLSKIRGAVQSLAGRNNYPFENGMFHGLISEKALKSLCGDEIEGNVVEVWSGGVALKPVNFITGAIIFGLHSDPLTLESHG
jgi:hypothetical protein